MRGLDTNILVRYLVADDARQAAQAERLLQRSSDAGEPLFIPILVLCELICVLARSYGQTRAEILAVLERILATDQFQIEGDQMVRRSLEAFRRGRADFTDYLIGEICRDAGCAECVTFDRRLKDAAGFTVLP